MDTEGSVTKRSDHLSRDEIERLLNNPTISLVEAGQALFGLKPQAAKAAGRRGEIPTIKIGRKLLVPTQKLREMLGLSEPQKAA